MTAPPEKARRGSKRPALSAERIATAAMALVDEDGLDGLSFRALAKRLGCQAMSLYHYYPSKQHLIDALVNICLAEIEVPAPGPSPRARIRQFCLNYRATVLRHPGFAPIFTTHRLNHREGLDKLNSCVAMFESDRIDTGTKATLFRVLSYFITGAAIDEALGYAKGPSAADPVPDDEALRDFPEIVGIGVHFSRENHLAFYEAGLEVMLDWIEAHL